MDFLLDFILHIDQYMIDIVQEYHMWAYAILFLIIFCETGLVVTPFLPGDSLLFVAGAIAALPDMPLEVNVLALILFVAAVLGDSCNYMIGHFFGRRLFNNPDSRIFKQNHLDKTHEFYKKYGGKTIIIARFVPIVRTFAPFVAGMGKMHYYYFMLYNLIGGACWIAIFCYAGYFFGDLPFVQENLKLLIVAIIVVSILPAVVEVLRARLKQRKQNKLIYLVHLSIMKNSFFSRFTPKEPKFFPLLKQLSEILLSSSALLIEILGHDSPEKRAEDYKRIKDLEREGDKLTNLILDELGTTFITPFDREDIHDLASGMDDVIDGINSCAKRITIYNPHPISDKGKELGHMVQQEAALIGQAMDELEAFRKSPDKLRAYCNQLHDIENRADDIYEFFITRLFEEEKDCIELIKIKEIMYELENDGRSRTRGQDFEEPDCEIRINERTHGTISDYHCTGSDIRLYQRFS